MNDSSDLALWIALGGVLLGVLNLWLAWWREQVRIKVRYFERKQGEAASGDDIWVNEIDPGRPTAEGVEECGVMVVNLGPAPVFIDLVGLRVRRCGSILDIVRSPDRPIPHVEIPARSGRQFLVPRKVRERVLAGEFRYVHAVTECGSRDTASIRRRWWQCWRWRWCQK